MLEFIQVVLLVFSTPNPDVVCYIQNSETKECVVYLDKSTGKFYDAITGKEIANPLP